MGSSAVYLSPESIESNFLVSGVSVFYYAHCHNGVLGTLYCQSINGSCYSRNWVDVEYLNEDVGGYLMEPLPDPLPDLRVGVVAALADMIFPDSRAPIWEQMRIYLIDKGCDYNELRIYRNEDEGCLDVFFHDRYEHAWAPLYDAESWNWYQIWDVSAPSLWHMAQCVELIGPIDL